MRSSVFPVLALRSGDGLPEIVPINTTDFPVVPSLPSSENKQDAVAQSEEILPTSPSEYFSIKPYETNPRHWGLPSTHKRAAIVPGNSLYL